MAGAHVTQAPDFVRRAPAARALRRIEAVAELSRTSAEAAPQRILANHYVLVVDDDADAREIFTAVLAYHGAFVRTARTAREALKLLTLMRPDVIISDIAMPNQSGLWLVRRLRQRGDSVPVIGVTGLDTSPEEMRRAGCDVGFTKPVDHGLLIQTLHALTARRRHRARPALPFSRTPARDLRRVR